MNDTKLVYSGKVSETGEITLPKRLRKEVSATFQGKEIEVVFARKRKRRSNDQNKYYWGIVIPHIVAAMIDLGNDALQLGNRDHEDCVHEFLKAQFLNNGDEVHGVDGILVRLPPSTKKCTTVDFSEYLDKVQRWANEFLGIVIPLPNEQVEMFAPNKAA